MTFREVSCLAQRPDLFISMLSPPHRTALFCNVQQNLANMFVRWGGEGQRCWRLPSPPELLRRCHEGHAAPDMSTRARIHHLIADLLAGVGGGRGACVGEDWRYRISNGPGMKRFLIFRLAAFQWTERSTVHRLLARPRDQSSVSAAGHRGHPPKRSC